MLIVFFTTRFVFSGQPVYTHDTDPSLAFTTNAAAGQASGTHITDPSAYF